MTVGTRIQIRQDTAANWTSANPILFAGEFGLETDNAGTATPLKFKLGDGVTAWTALPYELGQTSPINGGTP
jgi:hypothetical protein